MVMWQVRLHIHIRLPLVPVPKAEPAPLVTPVLAVAWSSTWLRRRNGGVSILKLRQVISLRLRGVQQDLGRTLRNVELHHLLVTANSTALSQQLHVLLVRWVRLEVMRVGD